MNEINRGVIDMTDDETTTQERELPYGGTVSSLRQMVAKHAQHGEAQFLRTLNDVPPGERPKVTGALEGEEFERTVLAHHAALYGWSIVAVLRWLGEKYGPDAAYSAAAMVQDLGENGGNDWVDDIPTLTESQQPAEVQR